MPYFFPAGMLSLTTGNVCEDYVHILYINTIN